MTGIFEAGPAPADQIVALIRALDRTDPAEHRRALAAIGTVVVLELMACGNAARESAGEVAQELARLATLCQVSALDLARV